MDQGGHIDCVLLFRVFCLCPFPSLLFAQEALGPNRILYNPDVLYRYRCRHRNLREPIYGRSALASVSSNSCCCLPVERTGCYLTSFTVRWTHERGTDQQLLRLVFRSESIQSFERGEEQKDSGPIAFAFWGLLGWCVGAHWSWPFWCTLDSCCAQSVCSDRMGILEGGHG
jgi:hypothetical protein